MTGKERLKKISSQSITIITFLTVLITFYYLIKDRGWLPNTQPATTISSTSEPKKHTQLSPEQGISTKKSPKEDRDCFITVTVFDQKFIAIPYVEFSIGNISGVSNQNGEIKINCSDAKKSNNLVLKKTGYLTDNFPLNPESHESQFTLKQE